MKRLFFLLVFFIILYSTYYDLTSGTLPKAASPETTDSVEVENDRQLTNMPFQEVIVDNGYTVLSIVEHLHDGPVPASIQQIIYDFKELNPNIEPEAIQVGKSYLFPLYKQTD